MCNELHKGFHEIPVNGTAYKIFNKDKETGDLIGMCNDKYDFVKLTNSNSHLLAQWDYRYQMDRYEPIKTGRFGFCMFMTHEEAEKCLREWKIDFPRDNSFIFEIQYLDGIGEFTENRIISGLKEFKIAICKAFIVKPLKD